MPDTITRSATRGAWMLWLLLVLAFAVRGGWALTRPATPDYLASLPDQLEYLELGRSLISGHGLRFRDVESQQFLYAYRTPGYPLLVAACAGNVTSIRLVQSLIDTSTVLAVYVLARRWLGCGASLFAAAMVAVNPFLIFFCSLILSETLFTAMLAWGMALLVTERRRARSGTAGFWTGAILLSLSVLVRPSALLLPVALGLTGVIGNTGERTQTSRSRWLTVMIPLLLTGLVVGTWGARNRFVVGSWIFTTTNAGVTLYDGFNPDATGASDQRFVRSLVELHTMSEIERSDYLSQRAWEYIRTHPARAVSLTAAKIARTWSPVPLSSDYGTRRNVAVAACYMIPFYVLVVLGLWFGRAPASARVFLLIPAIYFTVVHALSVGSLRYRVPADVPMAILAATCVSGSRGGAFRRLAAISDAQDS